MSDLELDGSEGPALPISARRTDDLLEAALKQGFDVAEAGTLPAVVSGVAPVVMLEPTPAAAVARGRSRRAQLGLQAAAALLLGLVVAGSASAALRWWEPREPATSSPTQAAKKGTSVRSARAPSPVSLETTVVAPEVADTKDEDALERSPAKPRVAASARAAQDWLDQGNRLRAQAKWREAYQAYAQIWQRAPESSAAYVARIAAANLRLEHFADPRGALGLLRAAIKQSPNGVLDEEARYGVAEAQRKLGDARAEQRALEELLAKHPQSAESARARARLARLREAGIAP
ncbi:MAG: hypothetical protein QM778_23845 [Myxococcales bacterium]